MNRKKYESLGTYPIQVLLGSELSDLIRKDIKYLMLFSDLKKILLSKYGKQTFCVNYGGRRFWVWNIKMENALLLIFCNGIRGTKYEVFVTGDTYTAKAELLDFLENLAEEVDPPARQQFHITTDNLII